MYLRSESWRRASGRCLTGKQQSVAFHHLGHTGLSTTRVPDLDTSLAINGLRKLAACYTGQDPALAPQLSFFLALSIPFLLLRLCGSCSRAQYGRSQAVVIAVFRIAKNRPSETLQWRDEVFSPTKIFFFCFRFLVTHKCS